MRLILLLTALALAASADVRTHPGGKELPHEKYIRVVSESDSPVERLYIKTKDGLYVAAALRKPKGAGPFPALVYFHGAPGGRGMEQLAGWSLGATGGPVWERFLQEGFVVVVSDYRGGRVDRALSRQITADDITYVDDGLAIVEHVRSLSYVDSSRITAYGVSLGGNLVMHLIARANLKGAILGAPATISFLGMTWPAVKQPSEWKEAMKSMEPDPGISRRNIDTVQTPVLILAGTADELLPVDRRLHAMLEKSGKPVRMEVYENGYHDFCVGPQGHPGRKEPLLDATLDALEKSLDFARNGLK